MLHIDMHKLSDFHTDSILQIVTIDKQGIEFLSGFYTYFQKMLQFHTFHP